MQLCSDFGTRISIMTEALTVCGLGCHYHQEIADRTHKSDPKLGSYMAHIYLGYRGGSASFEDHTYIYIYIYATPPIDLGFWVCCQKQ